MKTKKTVLMYSANEITREVLEFQMKTWGYDVISTSELCLMTALKSRPADLVLMLPGFERPNWREFERVAMQLEMAQTAAARAIRIYDTQSVLPVYIAPHIFRITNVPLNSVEYFRTQLKIIMHRKRGPRKAPQSLAVCA